MRQVRSLLWRRCALLLELTSEGTRRPPPRSVPSEIDGERPPLLLYAPAAGRSKEGRRQWGKGVDARPAAAPRPKLTVRAAGSESTERLFLGSTDRLSVWGPAPPLPAPNYKEIEHSSIRIPGSSHRTPCEWGRGVAALPGRSVTKDPPPRPRNARRRISGAQAASISSHCSEMQRTPKLRFSATVGQEPEIELALV